VLPAGQVVFAQEESPLTDIVETAEADTGAEAGSDTIPESDEPGESGENSGEDSQTEESASETSNDAGTGETNSDEGDSESSSEGESQESETAEESGAGSGESSGEGAGEAGDSGDPENSDPENKAGQDADTEEDNVGEAVDALIEGNAALLDENGDPLTLASQETHDILSSALDPQFCPDGYSPTIWGGDDSECGEVHDNIAAAIQDAVDAGVSGTIYIQAGTFNEFVNLEGYSSQVTLVLLGGVTEDKDKFEKTTIGEPKSDKDVSSLTVDEGGIHFAKNDANITLANFVLKNGHNIVFEDNIGNLTLENIEVSNAKESGVVVSGHEGNVTLDEVTVTNSGDDGISIENRPDREESAPNKDEKKVKKPKEKPGDVTVTNTTVIGNQGDGIKIVTAGNVLLDNVTAKFNRFDGADIDNSRRPDKKAAPTSEIQHIGSGVTVKNSVFIRNGASRFLRTFDDIDDNFIERGSKRNGRNGLEIESSGDVRIINIRAARNSGHGTLIETRGNVFVGNSSFANNGFRDRFAPNKDDSLFAEINHRRQSAGNGLDITTNGNVRIINVRAVRNDQFGISIETVEKEGRKPIQGKNLGNVFLGFVAANRNERGGAEIEAVGNVIVFGSDFRCNGNECFRRRRAVTELNEFSLENETLRGRRNRGATGLNISTTGNVVLFQVDANRNSGYGIKIKTYSDRDKGSPVKINNGRRPGGRVFMVMVNANKNDKGGAKIKSVSNVVVFGSQFNCNGTRPCFYDRKFTPIKPIIGPGFPVSADNLITAEPNFRLGTGNVTLLGVWANGNRRDGIDIATNYVCFGRICQTEINRGRRPRPANGLEIDSRGNVTLALVWANGNRGNGVEIETFVRPFGLPGPPRPVSSINPLISMGNVVLRRVTADYNRTGGADIDAIGNVSVYRSTFNRNGSFFGRGPIIRPVTEITRRPGIRTANGLDIVTTGNVFVNGVTASSNSGDGIAIEAYRAQKGLIPGSIDTNLGSLLGGNVTLNNVVTRWNALAGTSIYAARDVSVARSTFSHNGLFFFKGIPGAAIQPRLRFTSNGLEIFSHGNVDINRVQTIGNSGHGVYVDVISRKGPRSVTLNHITAKLNGRSGAFVSNHSHGRPGPGPARNFGGVFIRYSTFINNRGNGLRVVSNQPVSLRYVTARRNVRNGAILRAYGRNGDVNVGYSYLGANRYTGLVIRSTGDVTVRYTNANNNRFGGGAFIRSDGRILAGYNNFNNNGWNGITALSWDRVVLRHISACNNRGAGARINNARGGGNVRVIHSDFCDNNRVGVGIRTAGEVIVADTAAVENGRNGIRIWNQSGNDIMLSNTTVTTNTNNGIGIYSAGYVSMTNTTANDNLGNGVAIFNAGGTGIDFINGTFSNNGLNGILASSDGKIFLDGVQANDNAEAGARLSATLGAKQIWIHSIAYTGNGTYGIQADVGDGTLFLDCGVDLRNNGLGPLALNINGNQVELGNCVKRKFSQLDQAQEFILDKQITVQFPANPAGTGCVATASENLAHPSNQGVPAGMRELFSVFTSENSCITEGYIYSLTFPLPAGIPIDSIAVLVWDTTLLAWVELDFEIVNGMIVVATNYWGDFSVVQK